MVCPSVSCLRSFSPRALGEKYIEGSEGMAKYILKRIVMAIVTVLVVSCVTFLLMMSVPGSPFASERALTPQQVLHSYLLN